MQKYGKIGYDCRIGYCDFIPLPNYPGPINLGPVTINLGIVSGLGAMVLPCSMVVISYAYLAYYFWKYFRNLKMSNIQTQVEFRTTWTLFLVFLFNAFVIACMYILIFQLPKIFENT